MKLREYAYNDKSYSAEDREGEEERERGGVCVGDSTVTEIDRALNKGQN